MQSFDLMGWGGGEVKGNILPTSTFNTPLKIADRLKIFKISQF